MPKKEEFITNAPQTKDFTVRSGTRQGGQAYIPGDSIDGYTDLKTANTILSEKEIGQQRENN